MQTQPCLFVFRSSLCVLIFDIGLSIAFDDCTLKGKAMSWPYLDTLRLYSDTDEDYLVPTTVMLYGLAHFDRYYPDLASPETDVDTSRPGSPRTYASIFFSRSHG